jgi:hypothetical protein
LNTVDLPTPVIPPIPIVKLILVVLFIFVDLLVPLVVMNLHYAYGLHPETALSTRC